MGETGRPEKRVTGALGDFCIRMNNLGMNRQLWKRKKTKMRTENHRRIKWQKN